eukprot:5459238-Alexandrium_andersonii.AAC.1
MAPAAIGWTQVPTDGRARAAAVGPDRELHASLSRLPASCEWLETPGPEPDGGAEAAVAAQLHRVPGGRGRSGLPHPHGPARRRSMVRGLPSPARRARARG